MRLLYIYIFTYFLFFIPFSLLGNNGCELYELDFQAKKDSTSNYQVSCGDVSSSQWTVIDDTCQLTTKTINLGGSTGDSVTVPVTVKVNPSGNLQNCNDYIVVQYQANQSNWVQQDSINACDSNFNNNVQTFVFDVTTTDTSTLTIGVILASGDASSSGNSNPEKLRIKDGGICVGGYDPLPIELASFQAEKVEQGIRISWTTATETNNDHFTLERSEDGEQFKPLKTIDGQGDNQTAQSYEVYDAVPHNGTNYYRLKQMDKDGTSTYSEVIVITYKPSSQATMRVYPNPNNGRFHIATRSVTDEELLVILYNQLGQKVYSKVIPVNSDGSILTAIDTQNKLAPGVYLMVGNSGDHQYKKRVVIQ